MTATKKPTARPKKPPQPEVAQPEVQPLPRTAPESYSAREFIRLAIDRHTLSSVSRDSRVPYSTLNSHVVHGRGLSPANAKKLELWSEGRISAAKTLGL